MRYSGVTQEILRGLVERRHPEYWNLYSHWEFLAATYKGGREWFLDNLFPYRKEGGDDYMARINRAYRFNHTREVVDLIQKYIFKSPAIRNTKDASEVITKFWATATLSGLTISQFMESVSKESSKMGSIWVCVDTNVAPGYAGVPSTQALSVKDAKAIGARAYAFTVKIDDVLDYRFAADGSLDWFLVREWKRDDFDPLYSDGSLNPRFRLWTRTDWSLFEFQPDPDPLVKPEDKKQVVVQIGEGVNSLKEIPYFRVDHVISENKWSSSGLIDDIAYLDRAVANYLSNIDEIIQDQTFSQLVMPAQSITPGEDGYDKLIEAGTKRIFTYDSEGGVAPEYISPDPKQAGVILQVINKIISEIYHTIGMAGERTKQDNAVGIDNSSGVAKAYDFERVNSLLVSKATCIENAENNLVRLVMAWNSEKAPDDDLVKYPETFDVRSLFDEFTIAQNLQMVEAPDTVRRAQMDLVIDKMFPRLAKDLRAAMTADLKSWPPKVDLLATAIPTKFGKSGAKPAAKKRQGQVTKSTK